MKISATALVIVIATLFSALQVALATPLGLEHRAVAEPATSPNPDSTLHQLFKRSCGGTNYCSASRMYPGCTDWTVGYRLCSVMYKKGSRSQAVCMFCVEKNCNDTICDKLFNS